MLPSSLNGWMFALESTFSVTEKRNHKPVSDMAVQWLAIPCECTVHSPAMNLSDGNGSDQVLVFMEQGWLGCSGSSVLAEEGTRHSVTIAR